MNPKVSIITPSYNQGQFLEETILSVLNQTYNNIEYIIIDGGSSDKSVEIIKKHDKQISYWVSEKDKGQADAINKGFAKASGELLCWVNSDDVLYPEFISNRIDQFEKNNSVAMIYGDVDQGFDFQYRCKRKGSQQLWLNMITNGIVRIPQMSALWKREVYETVGQLDTSLNVLLDWEYFVRIAKRFQILYCPGSVAFFRQHENSKSVKLNSQWVNEIIRYYDENIFKNKNNQRLNYNHIHQNIYFLCSNIFEESLDRTEVTRYLELAKDISFIRYYRIQVIRFIRRILSKAKKAYYKWMKILSF